MDDERTDSGGDCPECELCRLDVNSILVEESLDQENRPYRDEDVFTKKEGDVVDRRRVRADFVTHRLRELSVLILGGALSHRRDEWPHHLCVPTQRRQPERGGDLPDSEVSK